MQKTIYLAGGCFWGLEAFMKKINGIISAQSGYANGGDSAPSYQDVCNGSGHAEVVKVIYNTEQISLEKLLSLFFQVIDPTTLNQQGADKGIQYRTGIYFIDEQDKSQIDQALSQLQQQYNTPIVVENQALTDYYPAEEYHQNYLTKNPTGYCHIDIGLMNKILAEQNN